MLIPKSKGNEEDWIMINKHLRRRISNRSCRDIASRYVLTPLLKIENMPVFMPWTKDVKIDKSWRVKR